MVRATAAGCWPSRRFMSAPRAPKRKVGGVTLQIVRGWVLKFNAHTRWPDRPLGAQKADARVLILDLRQAITAVVFAIIIVGQM